MSWKVLHLEEEIVRLKKDSKENINRGAKELFKDASECQNLIPISAKKKSPVVQIKSITMTF